MQDNGLAEERTQNLDATIDIMNDFSSNSSELYDDDSDGDACRHKCDTWEGSDSGVDVGNSSGGSIADDCPVVSINDVVAYYDLKPRRLFPPSYYQLDIDGMIATAHYESETTSSELEGGGERLSVLTYEQVSRLNDVMDEVLAIHGRGNFPTLNVRLRDLVAGVRAKLEEPSGAALNVRQVRLNGGAASHVLASRPQPYSDIDLIFSVELPTLRHCDRVKAAVLAHLGTLMPPGRRRATPCSLKEAYVSKLVRVNNSEGDRWSLISLGNSRGHKNVELKFVDSMRRQFEFSVDSFQITLDSLLAFHECSHLPIGENFYPSVVGESVYGDFYEALHHLTEKLISTRHPEEIRGGGLLKYCALLAKGYRPVRPDYIKMLERYMCSRFFIDFSDLNQQRSKLEAYLKNHFVGRDEEALKYHYLTILYNVVRESTVCLMGHERRQTLGLIEAMACRELYAERARVAAAQPPVLVAHGYYYAAVAPASPCCCQEVYCQPPSCTACYVDCWQSCQT